MKKFKKLEVLVILFSIFSLFSLTNVNATDRKEIKEVNVEKNMDFDEKSTEIFSENKYINSNYSHKQANEISEELNILGDKKEENVNNVNDNKKIITKKELDELSEKFLKNSENVDFDDIFQNIFSCFGYYGKKSLEEKGHPYIFVVPYSRKYKTLKNGEKKVENYNTNYVKELFSYSEKDFFNNIQKTFGSNFITNVFYFYKFCLDINLDVPISFFYNCGKRCKFSIEMLKDYFKFAIANKQDFKKPCEDLVKYFLTKLYLKSFFLNNYADRYNFDYDVRDYILRFSKIIFKALKVEFNSDSLQDFYLDFNAAIESEEDEKMLKRLYNILFNKYERYYVVDNLLYDLYNSTSAFLQNKEFWNKMLGMIVADCCKVVSNKNYEYKDMENFISEEYFNFYSEIDKKIKNLIVRHNNKQNTNKKNERNFEINFNKDVEDYDFGLPSTSLHRRFKKIFSLLDAKMKKNYFALLNNKKKDSEQVEGEDDVYLSVKKKSDLKDFNIMELEISNNLSKYWYDRFQKSFGILLSFDYFIKKFDNLLDVENSNRFKLFGKNKLTILDKVMLKCSNYAFRNERIKEECLALTRYMFDFFSIYGFIKFYGNFGNKDDILILEFVEYLGSILDVCFEENSDGNFELKLGFKKTNKNNYFAKKISDVIEKFQNKENWDKATQQEKLIYRLFLTAKSFVDAGCFWNRFISFLVFSNQFMTAKNYYSDKESLCDEYKKVNEKIGEDEAFLNSIEPGLDKNIVNFITGKSCKNIEEVVGFKNEEFVKDFFALRNNKEILQERFKKNMEIFRNNFNNINLALLNDIEFTEKYSLRRYNSVFSCGTLESILIKFNKFLNSYEKGDYNKYFPKTFYKEFLNNEEIANECISSIEKFFHYYMIKLIPKCYSKEYDEFLSYFGKGFVESILKWYVRMFNVKVKDSNLNFNFNLGYFEECIYWFTGVFVSVFDKYKNKADNEKFFQSKGIKERAERFLYSLYVDAFAFLSSEDFWNAFMSDLIYKKILAMQVGKVNSKTKSYESFKDVLNLVQRQVEEKVKENEYKIEQKNKYKIEQEK